MNPKKKKHKENYTKVRLNQISPTPFFPEGQSKLTVFTQLFFFLINLFIYLYFIFGCVGSSLLPTGFL